MIVGRIDPGERTVRFELDLRCSDCGRSVPGGMKASEAFYNSAAFCEEIGRLVRGYACGPCRDRRRAKSSQIRTPRA